MKNIPKSLEIFMDKYQTPVFIFQMGKVGSSSLKVTLEAKLKGAVVHSHSYKHLSKENRKMLDRRKRLKLPISVICPVREPISRNVSAFF